MDYAYWKAGELCREIMILHIFIVEVLLKKYVAYTFWLTHIYVLLGALCA